MYQNAKEFHRFSKKRFFTLYVDERVIELLLKDHDFIGFNLLLKMSVLLKFSKEPGPKTAQQPKPNF